MSAFTFRSLATKELEEIEALTLSQYSLGLTWQERNDLNFIHWTKQLVAQAKAANGIIGLSPVMEAFGEARAEITKELGLLEKRRQRQVFDAKVKANIGRGLETIGWCGFCLGLITAKTDEGAVFLGGIGLITAGGLLKRSVGRLDSSNSSAWDYHVYEFTSDREVNLRERLVFLEASIFKAVETNRTISRTEIAGIRRDGASKPGW